MSLVIPQVFSRDDLGVSPWEDLYPATYERLVDVASETWEGEGFETDLPHLHYTIGSVERHTDAGTLDGQLVFGLVLESQGHTLNSFSLRASRQLPIPLKRGDCYILDPLDPHWTTTPQPVGLLVFSAITGILPKHPHGFLPTVKSRRHEMVGMMIEALLSHEQNIAHQARQERLRYRGVEAMVREENLNV